MEGTINAIKINCPNGIHRAAICACVQREKEYSPRHWCQDCYEYAGMFHPCFSR